MGGKVSETKASKLRRKLSPQEKYDKGVRDLTSGLQYFVDESSFSLKTPLVYGAFAAARFWSKPIKLSGPGDYILLPFRLIAELLALLVTLLGTAISAIPNAPQLHKITKNIDKIQDPRVLSTLLSDEKFWNFAINHIGTLRSIAIKGADPALKGLLTDLLTKEVMNDFKNTFKNTADKGFLREIFSLALDKNIKTLPKEQLNAKISKIVCARGFTEFLARLSSNERLFNLLCKHPPLNEVLNTNRVTQNLVVDAITGPVKDILTQPAVQQVLQEPTLIEALLAGKIPDNLQFTRETLPEFLTTVMTNEKLWNFVVEHTDEIRVATLRNSPEALRGLLGDLLDKKVLQGLKNTFQGETHKEFLKSVVALAFEQDRPISSRQELLAQVKTVLGLDKDIGGTPTEELQKKVSEIVKTDKYKEFIKDFSLKQLLALSYDSTLNWDIRVFFRAELATRMNAFMGSDKFVDFVRDFAAKDTSLLKALTNHSPLKDALDQFGISQDLLIKLVNGPVKKRPEDLKVIFESLSNGRFVQTMLELVRDHPDVYGTFVRDNAQSLRWPTDKFLNDNDYWIDENGKQQVFLKPVHDALRQFLPNMDFGKIIGAAMEMRKDDLTAMVKAFDAIMKPELTLKDEAAGAAHKLYSKLYSAQQFATAAQVPYHAQLGSFMALLNILRFAPLADMERITIAKQLGKLAGSDVVVESFLTNQAKEKASGKTSLPAALGIVTYDENGQKHNFLAEYLKGLNKTEVALDVASFPVYFILGYDPVDMYRQAMGSSAQPGVVESLIEFNKRQAKPFQDAVVLALASGQEVDLGKRFKAYYDGLSAEEKSKLENYKLNLRSLDYLSLKQLNLAGSVVENFTILSSSFNQSDFTKIQLIGTRISNTAILNSKFDKGEIRKCEFDNFNCIDSSFKGAVITECEFGGKVAISPDALKGAIIDSASLVSLIKACERSGVVLDLEGVNIIGDLYKMNWLSPAITNHDKALAGEGLKLRQGHTLPMLRILQIATAIDASLPTDATIADIDKLFRVDENDIMTTYLANNFKFTSSYEVENYDSPAGRIKYVVSQSLNGLGNIDERSLRRNLFAEVLAENVCKEIFPGASVLDFSTEKEQKALAALISGMIESLGVDSKEFQKMFQLDENGKLRLKPEHSKLITSLSQLIMNHSIDDMIGMPVPVTADTFKDTELQDQMRQLIAFYIAGKQVDKRSTAGLEQKGSVGLGAEERLSDLSKRMSKDIAEELWGKSGIEGGRKGDFEKLSEFVQSFVIDLTVSKYGNSADRAYREIAAKEDHYKGVIKSQIKSNALCSTAISWVTGKGTQLKPEFRHSEKFRRQLRAQILKEVDAPNQNRGQS